MAARSATRALPDRLDAPSGATHERLRVDKALEALLPEGGIRRGTAIAVSGNGSMTLAMALTAEASQVAAVGMADLGVAALAERGVDLGRWALVDFPVEVRSRDRSLSADVLGAVVGGFDLVLVGSGVRVTGATVRRLLARMREHGTSLICALGRNASGDVDNGLQPELRMMIEQTRWTGIGDGHGRLVARQAEVTVWGRGAASRLRRIPMWLPSEDGRVACAEPGQISASGDSFEDVRERRAG